MGQKIDVVCEPEPFDGREMERWRIYRRKELSLDAVHALDQQFAHVLRNGNGQTQEAPTATDNAAQ